jgi:hypothetical protein
LWDVSYVVAAVARVEVTDLDAALPLYQLLSDGAEPRRFAYGGIDLAWVGAFLLLAGPPEKLAAVRRSATLLVRDIDAAATAIRGAGGQILEGPAAAPNGPRMIARHPDGAVFEYIQPAELAGQ